MHQQEPNKMDEFDFLTDGLIDDEQEAADLDAFIDSMTVIAAKRITKGEIKRACDFRKGELITVRFKRPDDAYYASHDVQIIRLVPDGSFVHIFHAGGETIADWEQTFPVPKETMHIDRITPVQFNKPADRSPSGRSIS
jgi:hypothetical protein